MVKASGNFLYCKCSTPNTHVNLGERSMLSVCFGRQHLGNHMDSGSVGKQNLSLHLSPPPLLFPPTLLRVWLQRICSSPGCSTDCSEEGQGYRCCCCCVIENVLIQDGSSGEVYLPGERIVCSFHCAIVFA